LRLGIKVFLRLRFLLPTVALAVVLSSVRILVESGFENWVVYDYSIWLAVFLVCLGVYSDLRLLAWRFSYLSTLLLGLCGAVMAVAGRAVSLLLNQAIYFPYRLIPFFGSSYCYYGFLASLLSIVSGSILAFIALLLHSILGRPIVFHVSKSFGCAVEAARDALLRAWGRFWGHEWLYLLAAFLFGFVYRFLPELIWWPWPLGGDTVEYMAHLMDFLERLDPFTSYHWMGSVRNCPPLLNMLLAPFGYAFGAWLTFKLYPSVAYGLLSLSSALVARRVFRLGGYGAFFTSAVTVLFVLNLRISWDYQRQLLGSVFMILSLAILDSSDGCRGWRSTLSALLLVCCALSHEVTGFFSFVASALLAFMSARRRDLKGFTAGLASLAVSVALEAWYWRRSYTLNPYFGVVPVGVVSYSSQVTPAVLGYLIAGFGLILPFAMLALLDKDSPRVFSKIGLTSLLAAGVSPMFAPYTSAATWYRFLVGAAPIASTLAGSWIAKAVGDKRFHAIFIVLLLALAFPYAYGVEDTSRFTSALTEFPQGLVPLPKDPALLMDLKELSEWFGREKPSSTIIAEPCVAKWVHLAVRNPEPNELLWLWASQVSDYSVKSIMESLGLERVYVVCVYDLSLDVEGIRMLRVYLFEKVKCTPTTYYDWKGY
jgi:hypothetical protein